MSPRCRRAALIALPILALAAGAAAARALDPRALGSYAFVSSRTASEVAVVDMKAYRVAARLPLAYPAYQLAVSEPRGEFVVGTIQDRSLHVFDLAELREVRSAVLDHEPEHIQLAPDGSLLAVGNYYGDALTLVRLDDMSTRRVDGLLQPHNIVWAPDGQTLYVANLGANTVSVVDVNTARVREEIFVPRPPDQKPGITDVQLSRDGRRLIAIPATGSDLPFMNTGTGAAIRSPEVGELPWRVALTADDRLLVSANQGDRTLTLVRTADGSELARLPGAPDVATILLAWFDTLGIALSRRDRTAVLIDLDQGRLRAPLALPDTPVDGIVTADGSQAFVALAEQGYVAVIDARERRITRVIEGVILEPAGIVTAGSSNTCH